MIVWFSENGIGVAPMGMWKKSKGLMIAKGPFPQSGGVYRQCFADEYESLLLLCVH